MALDTSLMDAIVRLNQTLESFGISNRVSIILATQDDWCKLVRVFEKSSCLTFGQPIESCSEIIIDGVKIGRIET
jgi:hypothetical protein